MSEVKPRFVVLDDKDSCRYTLIRKIRAYDPEAEIVEYSHPYLFKKYVEAKRATGEWLAKPTVCLSDLSMPWSRAEKTDDEHALGLGFIGDENFREYDNFAGFKKAVAELAEWIGDFICVEVASDSKTEQDPAMWKARGNMLNIAERAACINKNDITQTDIGNLATYLQELIAQKGSQ